MHTRHRMNIPALRERAGHRARGIQIGPRIRIGGTVGKIGESVKQNLGQVAKIAAVPVSFVNPALGAALAVGGRALHTNEGAAGFGDLAGAGLKNYATGKALKGVAGGLKGLKTALPAVMGMGGGGDGMPSTIPGEMVFDGEGNIISQGAERAVDGGGGIGDMLLKGAKRVLGGGVSAATGGGGGGGGGFGMEDLALGGLAAYQMKASADAAKRRGEYSDAAIAQAKDNWSRGQVLRDKGLAGLTTRTPVDLSAVYGNPMNPMSRPVAPVAAPVPHVRGAPIPARKVPLLPRRV